MLAQDQWGSSLGSQDSGSANFSLTVGARADCVDGTLPALCSHVTSPAPSSGQCQFNYTVPYDFNQYFGLMVLLDNVEQATITLDTCCGAEAISDDGLRLRAQRHHPAQPRPTLPRAPPLVLVGCACVSTTALCRNGCTRSHRRLFPAQQAAPIWLHCRDP